MSLSLQPRPSKCTITCTLPCASVKNTLFDIMWLSSLKSVCIIQSTQNNSHQNKSAHFIWLIKKKNQTISLITDFNVFWISLTFTRCCIANGQSFGHQSQTLQKKKSCNTELQLQSYHSSSTEFIKRATSKLMSSTWHLNNSL